MALTRFGALGSRLLGALLVGALLAWLPGAVPAAASTFRIAVGIDPDSMDPLHLTTTTVSNMIDYVVETLTTIDETGTVLPLLAESWTVSPDGRQYTFKLRPDVRFHDGSPFDARAVKWNFDRLIDPAVRVPLRASYPIERTEVVDAHSVRVVLKHPFAPFLGALSWGTAGLLSPAAVDRRGNDYKHYAHIVGTGPYVYRERRRGESVTVAKYADYWGRKPYYDTVVFRIVPEAATRESLLLAGQVDLVILPPVADIPALQRNPAVRVLLAPSDRTIFIAANTTKPPLDDRRVRQALNYAVDKQAIIDAVLFGAAEPMDAPMAPSLFGYCQVGQYEHNPARARELLAQAGVKRGTRVQLIHPTGRYVQDREAAQAVAGYLREVGLEPDLQTMDWPSYIRTIMTPADKNTTELHLLGWAPPFLDASQQMLQFLGSYHPPGGLATSFYQDPEVDRLIEAAQGDLNPDRRRELYCQVSRKVWEDAPWIFLWVQRFPIVHSAKVTNISSLPNEKFYALYARPAQ
jgi:ABC-type transport system substrate-binding protein